MSAQRRWSHLDDLRREELPDIPRGVANTLDDWLFRMHGVTSSGHHAGVFLNLLERNGLRIEPARPGRAAGEAMSATTDRLDEIEQRAAAATPGPWVSVGSSGFTGAAVEVQTAGHETLIATGDRIVPEAHADAEFIAHARDDVPWLVAELRAARAEIGRLNLRLTLATNYTATLVEDRDDARRTAHRWRSRAESAEAAVERVHALLDVQRRISPSPRMVVGVADVQAALDGTEQPADRKLGQRDPSELAASIHDAAGGVE